MRIDWDDKKSDKLQRERGLSFDDVCSVIKGPHAMAKKNDDPEQYIGIGFANGLLITVVYEFREDTEGDFIWLITYWKSTKSETNIYEKYRK